MKNSTKYPRKGAFNKAEEKKEGVFRDWLQFEKYKHFDEDLEAAVLGVCLLEPDGMSRIRRFLSAEMFYYDFHKSVYRAMMRLFDDGLPIDILTVVNFVYANPDEYIQMLFARNEGAAYQITALTNRVVQGAHMEYWSFLIREQFIARELLKLTTAGMSQDTARGELTRVQNQIDALLQYRTTEDDWMHISTVLVKLWQHMQEIRDKKIIGLPFGFRYLDKITSGISPGLYYLAARPSVGKTALAIKMILNQASEGHPVGIISLETPGVKLGARMLSMISRVDFWRIYRNKMSEELERTVYNYSGAAFELPIWVSDQPAVSTNDIRAKVFKLIKQGAEAIYIDYLQLVQVDEREGTREQEVAKQSRELKLLSMQTNIPIIALAQLSRASENRNDKIPRLHDLRESGSLEQDADGVMLLHRPEKAGIDSDQDGHSTKGKATLIVAKWRDGETFDHPMIFEGDRMEFSEDIVSIEEARGWSSDDKLKELPNAPTAPRDFTQSKKDQDAADDLPF